MCQRHHYHGYTNLSASTNHNRRTGEDDKRDGKKTRLQNCVCASPECIAEPNSGFLPVSNLTEKLTSAPDRKLTITTTLVVNSCNVRTDDPSGGIAGNFSCLLPVRGTNSDLSLFVERLGAAGCPRIRFFGLPWKLISCFLRTALRPITCADAQLTADDVVRQETYLSNLWAPSKMF